MENYSHEQIQYQPETGMLFEIYDTDGFFNSKHWHNGLEIIYLIAGGMTLNISESNYMLKPGGFIVVNSKTIHSVICREKGRHLLLQIPYEILEKSISNIDIIKFNCYSAPAASDGNGNNAGVRETLEKLKSLFEAPRRRLYFNV